MRSLVLACCVLGLVIGCNGSKGGPADKKATFPVSGKVTVDGQAPTTTVLITCNNVAGSDKEAPTIPVSETDAQGAFAFGTYEKGDGVPAGEYALTFESHAFQISMGDKPIPDLLQGRYSDPKKSEVKFSVKDKPVDLGEIKLTTK